MIDFVKKLEHLSGYKSSSTPSNNQFVLGHDGNQYYFVWYPTANPPTIAEIEAVKLPPDPTIRHIAPYDFQSRFTDAELVAIQTSVDPILIRGRTKLQTIITYVDLDLTETQQFIGYLAMIGVIEQSRIAEILA